MVKPLQRRIDCVWPFVTTRYYRVNHVEKTQMWVIYKLFLKVMKMWVVATQSMGKNLLYLWNRYYIHFEIWIWTVKLIIFCWFEFIFRMFKCYNTRNLKENVCLAVQLSWLTRLVLSKLRNKVNLAILSCFILLPENCNVASYLNFNIWSVEEGYHVLSCFPYCFMILFNYIVSFYHIFLFIILFYLSYCYHIISYCFIILYNP